MIAVSRFSYSAAIGQAGAAFRSTVQLQNASSATTDWIDYLLLELRRSQLIAPSTPPQHIVDKNGFHAAYSAKIDDAIKKLEEASKPSVESSAKKKLLRSAGGDVRSAKEYAVFLLAQYYGVYADAVRSALRPYAGYWGLLEALRKAKEKRDSAVAVIEEAQADLDKFVKPIATDIQKYSEDYKKCLQLKDAFEILSTIEKALLSEHITSTDL